MHKFVYIGDMLVGDGRSIQLWNAFSPLFVDGTTLTRETIEQQTPWKLPHATKGTLFLAHCTQTFALAEDTPAALRTVEALRELGDGRWVVSADGTAETEVEGIVIHRDTRGVWFCVINDQAYPARDYYDALAIGLAHSIETERDRAVVKAIAAELVASGVLEGDESGLDTMPDRT